MGESSRPARRCAGLPGWVFIPAGPPQSRNDSCLQAVTRQFRLGLGLARSRRACRQCAPAPSRPERPGPRRPAAGPCGPGRLAPQIGVPDWGSWRRKQGGVALAASPQQGIFITSSSSSRLAESEPGAGRGTRWRWWEATRTFQACSRADRLPPGVQTWRCGYICQAGQCGLLAGGSFGSDMRLPFP